MNKPILDACCGSRMFWFDKENPNVEFVIMGTELVIMDALIHHTGEKLLNQYLFVL